MPSLSVILWPIFQELKLWNIIPCRCSQSSRIELHEALYIFSVLHTAFGNSDVDRVFRL